MIRLAAVYLLVLLPVAPHPVWPQGPMIRVLAGQAQLAEGRVVRALEPRTGAVALAEETGWLETSARGTVELAWRGLASATIEGPAAFQLERSPVLVLTRFRVAEIEVRRGKLVLELVGAGSLELAAGSLQARALPGGVLELLNRGAGELLLRREDEPSVAIPAWQRVRVRASRPAVNDV
jgi:hypothetical protein